MSGNYKKERSFSMSKKMGRPKKEESDKVRNHIISVDYMDYMRIKSYCSKNSIQIKEFISSLLFNAGI